MVHHQPMKRRQVILTVGSTFAALGVVAFAVFRPDKLVVDDRVEERLAPEVAAALDSTTTNPSSSVPATAPGVSADAQATAPPTPVPPLEPDPAVPVVVASGDFVGQAGYRVSGRAAVVEVDGVRQLVLEDLDADNGPDLRLYLSPSPEGSVAGGAQIAPLKGNQGTQTYELPGDLDVSALPHVVIWCERFAAPFGTATVSM